MKKASEKKKSGKSVKASDNSEKISENRKSGEKIGLSDTSDERDAFSGNTDKKSGVGASKQNSDNINTARGANGRFLKGNRTPKSPGRPCKSKELAALLKPSYAEIKRILHSDASDKVKFEVAKWVVEMNIGKPTQQVDAKAEIDNAGVVQIKFEGELGEWSE